MATNVTPALDEYEAGYDNSSSDSAEEWTTTNHIWIYTSPLILAFGICGNILTMIVMSRPRMRGTSTSVFLTVLAAADMTVVVVGLLPEWLSQVHLVDLWDVHPWVCKIELYIYYTALDFAIWTLVAFSCDRFIAVCFPLKKRMYCTAPRAKVTCLLIFLLSNLNLHVFWTRGAAYNTYTGQVENCRYLPGYVSFELSVRPPIVFVAAFLVPCVVLVIWNSLIVARVMSARAMRQAAVLTSVRHAAATKSMRRGLTQTTAMCVSTCIAFVVLVLPNIVLFFGKKWWDGEDSYYIAKAVGGQLVYIHHSINFVLYSLTGSRFRRELAILCNCIKPSEMIGRLRKLSYNTSERVGHFSSRYTSSTKSSKSCRNSEKSPRLSAVRFTHVQNQGLVLDTIEENNHTQIK